MLETSLLHEVDQLHTQHNLGDAARHSLPDSGSTGCLFKQSPPKLQIYLSWQITRSVATVPRQRFSDVQQSKNWRATLHGSSYGDLTNTLSMSRPQKIPGETLHRPDSSQGGKI